MYSHQAKVKELMNKFAAIDKLSRLYQVITDIVETGKW